MSDKKLHSVNITKELNDIIYFLIEREEITKVVFVKRAIRMFMEGKRNLDERILIRKKSDPDYINRDTLFVFHIEEEYKNKVKELSEEYNEMHERKCKPAHFFFQILVEYCAYLISVDSTGIKISK